MIYLNNPNSSVLIVTEQGTDVLPFIDSSHYLLLENIFKLYGIDLDNCCITSLFNDENIKPGKKVFYKNHYKDLFDFLFLKEFDKVFMFSELLDKLVNDNHLCLPKPSDINKRSYAVVKTLSCLALPSIDKLLKDVKLERKGLKFDTYKKIKYYLEN